MSGKGATSENVVVALNREEWVDDVRPDGDDIRVTSSSAPNLRAVYDAADASGFDGTIHVDGVSGRNQSWDVTCEDGDVTDVQRASGAYTIVRMSRVERLFNGVMVLGVYAMIAAVIAEVGGLVVATPLDLVGSAMAFGAGLGLFVVGTVLFTVAPGMSHGPTEGDPGDGIPGFDRLPATDRAVLVAFDDAKSERNSSALLQKQRAAHHLTGFAFAAFLCVLGYVNLGALGVLVVGGLFALRNAVQIGAALLVGAGLEEVDDPCVEEIRDEVHAAADGGARPTLLAYGDSSNAVHDNVAMAIPELNRIVLPMADIEKLEREELKAILAHEYKHVQSHRPMWLAATQLVLALVPGVAVLVADPALTPVQLGAGLFVYFAVVNAALALVRRRWEDQADAFAADVTSPMGLVYGLTRLTDRHIIDEDEQALLAGSTGELYGTHPFPHRRVAAMVRREVE